MAGDSEVAERELPHETLVLGVHWRVVLALEGSGKLRAVHKRSLDPGEVGVWRELLNVLTRVSYTVEGPPRNFPSTQSRDIHKPLALDNARQV